MNPFHFVKNPLRFFGAEGSREKIPYFDLK
jgi:hypothetical protein